MKVLVCGGAGYIGSHMVKMLYRLGYETVVFDNLSTGHEYAVKWGEFVNGDIRSEYDIKKVFGDYEFEAVMHFAASSSVSESVSDPRHYYTNNVLGSLNLLDGMLQAGVTTIIFSSTAAVYGDDIADRISEAQSTNPINPYGRSKRMVEQILDDYYKAYEIDSVSLRYFNAAGADPDGELGEDHDPETHLIPNILKVATGERSGVRIFGDDYGTFDGTCVRDYIHINDLCTAHLKAIEYLKGKSGNYCFNLGNGDGFSVREVLEAAKLVTGKYIPYSIEDRRKGDPAILVSDAKEAYRELGWAAAYTDIESIIETAWRYYKNK